MKIRLAVSLAGMLLATGACSSGGGSSKGPQPMGPQDGSTKSATFQARQEFQVMVPAGTKSVRGWFVMPQDDPAQEVKEFAVHCAFPAGVVRDSEGNKLLYVEVTNPTVKDFNLVQTFTITRREVKSGADPSKARSITDADRQEHAKHLAANANVIINDEIRRIAADVVGSEQNPVKAARKLYDWTLNNVEYWVKYPDRLKASPVGSTEYCLAKKTGNCTDFHSLWTSLARASGIPTRIVYGSFFKQMLDGQDKDQSYHCWPEFYAPGIGWVVHDVAVADLFVGDFELNKDNTDKVQLTTAAGYKGRDQAMVDYYFGNIEERRVVWSRGRDLQLDPPQAAGPVNAIAKAYVEVDGKVGAEGADKVWTRKLTFKEVK